MVVVFFSHLEVTDECHDDLDCTSNCYNNVEIKRYCCQRKYFSKICLPSCVGQSWSFDSTLSECRDGFTAHNCRANSWCVHRCSQFFALSLGHTKQSSRVMMIQPAASGTTVVASKQQQQQAFVEQTNLAMYLKAHHKST